MNDTSVSVSWFGRVKDAVKTATTKVVTTLSRVKNAVLAKIAPVLKTRAVRVMRTIGRFATIILGVTAAISALFVAPAMTVLVLLVGVLLWLGWNLGVKKHVSATGLMACWKVERVVIALAKALFGFVATGVFFAVVVMSAMTPAGIVNFALMFWVLYAIEMGADAKTPEEKKAADVMWRTATTATYVNDLYQVLTNDKRARA